LTHTSGVAYNFNSLELTRLGKSLGNPTYPLQHEPGDKWTYGASTRLLGDLIMEKTGQGLFEFFKESLLRPLDMNETFFEVPEDDSGRVVTIHQRTNKAFAEIKNPKKITAPEYGDGGLNSTASDYAKFLRMLLNNGTSDNGKLVLRPETIEMLASNHIGELRTELQPMARPTFAREFPVPESRGVDYWGLGFQIAGADSELGRSKGSLSWAGIFNTKFWVDREKNIGAILFMQYLPFEDKAHLEMLSRFEETIYKNLKSGFGE
ncbi:MAG: serine hydrolase, partial [Gammaproteobacteria bacterium]|nr:serine hydrolase [Gammaproteobacteria bacterium]